MGSWLLSHDLATILRERKLYRELGGGRLLPRTVPVLVRLPLYPRETSTHPPTVAPLSP